MKDQGSSEENLFEEARLRWEREILAKAIAQFPERRERFVTESGHPMERVYGPRPCSEQADLDRIGFPGLYPFTRGVQPTMYRGRLWTIRQYAGFGTAEESNRRNRYLLEHGSTGLSIAFDLPTQIGYDSDDPMALGEVGKVGVAVPTLREMERLFQDIPLNRVSTSMTINATASILLAMYVAVAEQQGVPVETLAGTVQNDVLKEYVARGAYRFPPGPSLRLIRDMFVYCTKSMPKWNTISVSGFHIREAGATAAQEIAFTMADAICYVETALQAGLDVDDFAPRMTFFFAAHSDLLEEVAKFRAARRLYARIMRDRFHARDPRSQALRFHTQTSGVSLTAQQPENNVVRVAFQALAAVLGGTQSLHTNSRDEAFGLPSKEAVRLAVRTQQILADETGVANTIDPFGGSYCVEALTDDLEEEAQHYMKVIDDMGGMVRAIERGYIQQQIEEAAYAYGQSVEAGERVIVGVNAYQEGATMPYEPLTVSEEVERRQIEALARTRATRDAGQIGRALAAVEKAARTDENLMPSILDAVRAYASVGEISSAMVNVFGEYTGDIN